MDSVRACYETFLAEAGVPVPDNLAFRAGGWDYGSSPEDLHTYLEALNYAGYRIDSSACSGAFGTPSWRMGAEYQANVFRLGPDLIEVAPNEARNCGMPQHGLPSAFQSRSPGPGVFMNVLHFDHLFHRVRSGECQYFAVTDHDEIRDALMSFSNRWKPGEVLLLSRSRPLTTSSSGGLEAAHLLVEVRAGLHEAEGLLHRMGRVPKVPCGYRARRHFLFRPRAIFLTGSASVSRFAASTIR